MTERGSDGILRTLIVRWRELHVSFLAYGDLERNREAMARFGEGLKPVRAIARAVS